MTAAAPVPMLFAWVLLKCFPVEEKKNGNKTPEDADKCDSIVSDSEITKLQV